MDFKKLLKNIRIPNKHHLLHYAHNITHCTYLGAVTIFAHGPYAVAAGALLAVVVAGLFIGEEL